MIDRLQNYYGIAIRQKKKKKNDLRKMKAAVRATLFHVPHKRRIICIIPISQKEQTVGATFTKIEQMVQVHTRNRQLVQLLPR